MAENTTNKQLTVDDPVDDATLEKFAHLEHTRSQLGQRLIDLELDKVRTVRSATSVDAERQKLFEKLLTERGLPPNAPIQIDASTGKIQLLEQTATPVEVPTQQ